MSAGTLETPFVGRIEEVAVLSRALEDAVAGRSRIVTISGAPAIGKSRLVAELVERARPLARALIGVCHEDIAIPYLPFATALRALSDAPTWLERTDLDASWEADSAERNRLRLFLDVAGRLVDEAARQPVVLVIEDLHWADAATIGLLTYLSRAITHEAGGALPVMLVVTGRPGPTGDRTLAMERLARNPGTINIDLRPFTREESHALIAASHGAHPPADLLMRLHDASGGNPFLLRSALRRLFDEGGLRKIDGKLVDRRSDRHLVVRGDLDHEVRVRLEALDEGARQLLATAALLGDGRTFTQLRALTAGSMEDALTRSIELGFIERTSDDRYRFRHPEIRHVLMRDVVVADREELHLRIAEALSAEDDVKNAFDIASHLWRAGSRVDTRRMVDAAVLAGDRAAAAAAWAQSAKAFEFALSRSHVFSDDELAGVLVRAGTAAYYAHDSGGPALLRRAADLARRTNRPELSAEALLVLIRYMVSHVAAREGIFPESSEVEEALSALGSEHASLRARLLANMADMALVEFDYERGDRLVRLAEAELEGSKDAEAIARVHLALGLHRLGNIDLSLATEHYERAAELSEQAGDLFHMNTALSRIGLIELSRGEVIRGREHLENARREHLRYGYWGEFQLASAVLGTLAVAQGRFGDAERLVADALALYRIDEYAFIPELSFPTLAIARALRGDIEGATRAISEWRATGAGGTWRYMQLLQAWTEAKGQVGVELEKRPWPAPPRGWFTLDSACVHIEVAMLADAPSTEEAAASVLAEARERGVVFAPVGAWFVPRLVAESALLAGDTVEAVRLFTHAERIAADAGAKLEVGRCHLGLARAEWMRGRQSQSAAHARRAATELDAIGALVLAREARELLARTEAAHAVPTPAFRVLLVTDLQDSTGLNVRVGDERYLALLNEHDGVIRRRLRMHDGVEFQHRGDGIAAWFTTASDAVACAFGIRDDMARATGEHPELPFIVRVGIAAGEPIGVGTGLFGISVVAACRICDIARAGQILVADEVQALVRGKQIEFEKVGAFELKGLPGSTTLYEAKAVYESKAG